MVGAMHQKTQTSILTTFHKLLFFGVLLVVKHAQVSKRFWNLKQKVHSRIHQRNAYKLEDKNKH
jgi:hypothetical protein